MSSAPPLNYTPRAVANAILRMARQDGVPLTHMKLQKLVFLMHAWSLAIFNRPLVAGGMQAWEHGPVSEQLYHELKAYRAKPISDFLLEPTRDGELIAPVPARSDTQFYDLLARVWATHKGFSAARLSAMTHKSDSPWSLTRARGDREISDEDIRTHYADLMTNAR